MGFSYQDTLDMPEEDAVDFLECYAEMNGHKLATGIDSTSKHYVSRRKKRT